jgi:O-antigen ligase
MFLRLAQLLFLLLIFSLGFMQPHFSFQSYEIPLTEFIFLITFAVWLIAILTKQTDFKLSRFYLPLTLYFLSQLLSTIFSTNPNASFIKLLGAIYLLGLSVLSFNLFGKFKNAKTPGLTWLAATFIVCLISLFSLFLFYLDRNNPILGFTLSHYGSLPSGNYPRVQSSFLNPNMLCNYLNVSLVFIFAAYSYQWINGYLLGFFIFIFAICTLLTFSPGIGGILLVLGIWFWFEFNETKRFYTSKLSLWTGIFCALAFFLISLVSPANLSSIEPSPRVLTWYSTLQTLLVNPIFGRGLGLPVAHVFYLDASGNNQLLTDAHQLWLNVAGQQGFLGLFAIIFFTLFFLKEILAWFKEPTSTKLKIDLGLAFIGAFLYQGLAGSFEDARHLWVLIGFLANYLNEER